MVPRDVTPTPASTQVAQVLLSIPLATLTGLQWLTWLAVANNVAAHFHPLPWLAPLNWWLVAVAFVVFITPVGRMGIAVLGARMLLSNLEPGTYRRGARSICGYGWRSGWPTPAVRRTWPGPRGWCTTRGRWVTGSARAWICIRPRR